MTTFFIGIDASKGYADFAYMNESGQVLARDKLDDTAEGRRTLLCRLNHLKSDHCGADDTRFIFAAESSGGVEKNWLSYCRTLRADGFQVQVHQLNPLVVRKAAEVDLHRRKTDASDAEAVAVYLRVHERGNREYSPEAAESRMAAEALQYEITLGGSLRAQLQGLLVHVHPGLVQFCRHGIPQWVLHLVQRFPTARELALAAPEMVARIPYVEPARARRLVEEASESVAGSTGTTFALLVSEKARAIFDQNARIEKLESHLIARFREDQHFKILKSIRGVGDRTALWLRIIYGDFSGFGNGKKAVAYAGLDPMVEQSGDSLRRNRISKRGKGTLRAVLFMACKTAVRYPGVFRDFHDRLVARGKTKMQAIVACMAKMVRVAQACVLSEKEYDAKVHKSHAAAHNHALAKSAKRASNCLKAPVSLREARRRKRAAAPSEVEPQEAGSAAQT